MAKVLIADDEPMVVHLLKTVLRRLGHTVLTAKGGKAAVSKFANHRPEVTILDLNMPDMNGIDLLRKIRSVDRQAPIIVWSGVGTETLEREAQELGVTEFVKKGLSFHELGAALQRVLRAQDLYQGETFSGRNIP
jgi:DNA-binding response OmpR family regulator